MFRNMLRKRIVNDISDATAVYASTTLIATGGLGALGGAAGGYQYINGRLSNSISPEATANEFVMRGAKAGAAAGATPITVPGSLIKQRAPAAFSYVSNQASSLWNKIKTANETHSPELQTSPAPRSTFQRR
jgi:hypothetical protein